MEFLGLSLGRIIRGGLRSSETHGDSIKTFAELGINGPRQRNVGLENARPRFFHFSDGADTIHLVVMNNAANIRDEPVALAGVQLNNLLASVAPTRPTSPQIGATVGDLVQPDEARQYEAEAGKLGRQFSEVEQMIVDRHRRHQQSPFIGQAYNEFDESGNREAMLKALNEASEEVNDLHYAAWKTRFIDPSTFGKSYLQEIFADRERELKGPRGVDIDIDYILRTEMHTKLTKLHPLSARSKQALGNFFRTVLEPGYTYRDVLRGFAETTDTATIRALNEFALISAQESGLILVDVRKKRIIRDEIFGLKTPARLLRTGEVEYRRRVGNNDISIRVASGEINQQCNARIVAANIPSEVFTYALSPIIAYRVKRITDEQGVEREERIYITQSELPALLVRAGITFPANVQPHVFSGRIVMAYLWPYIVDIAARELPLERGGQLQDLMEGQVPVLYSLSARDWPVDSPHRNAAYADKILSVENPVVRVIEAAEVN